MRVLSSKLVKVTAVILIIFFISWSHQELKTADNPLTRKLEEVRYHIQEEKWQEAVIEIGHLKTMYDERRWVLELFGPIEHVNDARISLAALMEMTEQQNRDEALKLLAKVEARLNDFIIFDK